LQILGEQQRLRDLSDEQLLYIALEERDGRAVEVLQNRQHRDKRRARRFLVGSHYALGVETERIRHRIWSRRKKLARINRWFQRTSKT
jgi:hypothetical protein